MILVLSFSKSHKKLFELLHLSLGVPFYKFFIFSISAVTIFFILQTVM